MRRVSDPRADRIEEIEKEEIRPLGYTIQYIGPWRIVIGNKHDLPLEKALAKTEGDISIFTKGKEGSAGIIFNPAKEILHWAFDLAALHRQLVARSEAWIMPDRNTILCDRSNVTENELIGYLQRSLGIGAGC